MSRIKSGASRMGAVSAALGLVLASVIMASPASADDAVPPADPAVVTTTGSSVAPDPTASEEATSGTASTSETSTSAAVADDVNPDAAASQPVQPEPSKPEVTQKAAASAAVAAWTPESTVELKPTECWKEGDQPVLIGGATNIAAGEQLVTITIDGNNWAGDTEYRAAVGVHTYTYAIKNVETGEVVTSSVKTFTVEACTVTPPPFKPYETSAWWSMDHPNLNNSGSYEFPQTRLAGEPTPTCTPVKIQFDKYWIRDKADEDYLAALTKLNSPADDARLEPHGYYAKIIVLPASECQPKPANPTAVVTCDHCSDASAANGTATVTVTNVADETKAKATYTVTLNGVSKEVTLADGKSGKVHFSGLAPGTYDVTVAGNDGTSVKTSVKIDECKVTPPPAKKDAAASIVVTPATCTATGSVAWGNLVNAVATDLNQSVGTHVATSPAIEGHLFSDGMSVWEKEYTIQGQLTGKDCPPVTPESKVETVYGQWQGGQPSCKTPTVTWSRTVTTVTTTYGWEWDAEAGKYNPTAASSEVPGTPQTKVLKYEGKDCDTSPLTGTGAPQTGGSGDTTSPMNGWIGGGLLTAVAAALVVGVLRRRRA